MPLNQLIMAKLALNAALLAQGVATSGMISTVFDGVARHTREGHAFVGARRVGRLPAGRPRPGRAVRRRRPDGLPRLSATGARYSPSAYAGP